MNERDDWRRAWLVAAWPGMGAVAQIAATHLALQLHAQPIEAMDTRRDDEPSSVHVKGGLVQPWRASRDLLHGWRHPRAGHDLLVLLSERSAGAHARTRVAACARGRSRARPS